MDALFGAFTTHANLWINFFASKVDALPVSYSFGAGMLASVNPCGFVMLPAFAAFYFTTGVLMFGAAYAIASLGCTLPIFMVVVAGAFVDAGYLSALSGFLQYAAGMGFVLTIVAVGIALFRDQTARLVSGAMPFVTSAGNIVLILAGSYLIWYWAVIGGLLV